MAKEKTKLKLIRVGEVEEFAETAARSASAGEVVPASIHRARAWARNPNADPEDIALIVAYVGERCAGFLGLVPGQLLVKGRVEKVTWFSTWFVPEEFRTTGVGAALVMKAMSLRGDLAVTLVSGEAESVYKALRFREVGPLRYLDLRPGLYDPITVVLRVLRKWLQGRTGREFEWLNRVVARADRPWNWVSYRVMGLYTRKLRRAITISPAEAPPDCGLGTGAATAGETRFHRSLDVVRWMIDEPWLTTDPQQQTPGYFFKDYRPLLEFRVRVIRSAETNETLGWAVLRCDERESWRQVCVLDYHFDDPEHLHYLPAVALEEGRRMGADRLFLPEACEAGMRWPALLRAHVLPVLRLTYCRPSGKHSPLAEALPDLALDLCDGDFPFA